MSFLDRFQDKISTVTAHGHLKKADGSEEIRVGPYQPRKNPLNTKSGLPPPGNAVNHVGKLIVNATAAPDGHSSLTNNAPVPVPLDSSQAKKDGSISHRNYTLDSERRLRAAGKNSIAQLSSRSEQSDGDTATAANCGQIFCRTPPKMPRAFPSPKEVNEKLVKTEQDQLAFSRKSRPVRYEPCNLAQYRKEKPSGYYELGHLQPDLNSEELVRKRAAQERVRAFSTNLRTINKQICQPKDKKTEVDSIPSKDWTSGNGSPPKKTQSNRERALEFAKRVPKPRVTNNGARRQELDAVEEEANYKQKQMAKVLTSTSPAPPQHHSHGSDSSYHHASSPKQTYYQPISRSNGCDDDDDDYDQDSELQMLQTRHHQSKAQVEAAIRRR